MNTPEPRVLRKEKAAAYLGCSPQTLVRRADPNSKYFDPSAPRPVPQSAGVTVYYREDLDAWLDLCKERACSASSRKSTRRPNKRRPVNPAISIREEVPAEELPREETPVPMPSVAQVIDWEGEYCV